MHAFAAMGTVVTVAAPALDDPAEQALTGAIAALFADAERRFSRFRDDSELSRLNQGAGPVAVSPELLATVRAAERHLAATGGLFDIRVGAALRAAGYDRSFAPGVLDRDAWTPPAAAVERIVVDDPPGTVTRPTGVHLDLGGIAKGRTVDRAAALLPPGAFVDAGGDVYLHGDDPDGGGGWRVDVEDPDDARRVLLTLRVRDRGVATSAPNRRRWRAGAAAMHHLIDPRTGAPATSDLAQVTAIARTAEDADVLAKCAFLLGAAHAARFLREHGAAGVLVHGRGTVELVGAVEVDDA